MTSVTQPVVTQLAPMASRSTITTSGARPVPANSVQLQANVTTGVSATPFQGFTHPFSDPSMILKFTIAFSWDGGNTFPENATVEIQGSATGMWGKSMTPSLTRGLPSNVALGGPPTHHQSTLEVEAGGPIGFGVTLVES